MKPSAAYAAGLWTGAIVATTAAVVYVRLIPPRADDIRLPGGGETKEVLKLRQDNAKLTAETKQLNQTITELQRALATPLVSPAPPAFRDTPFRDGSAPAEATEGPEGPEEPAGAAALTARALAEVERLALQNDGAALDTLAAMAEHDEARSLMRVWSSGKLNEENLLRAARYLGSTVEVNPQGMEVLRQVCIGPAVNEDLVMELLAGLAQPSLPAGAALKADFRMRLRMLDALRASAGTGWLRARLEEARADVVAQLAGEAGSR